MKKTLTRRDFLRLSGLLPLGYLMPQFIASPSNSLEGTDEDNVLIIVFDAWSAANTSLYGYPRKTTPNLERLADKAVVYHNHYANGNFTTPGTASILTGTMPWTHRALTISGMIDSALLEKSIFHAFGHYHRMAYTHNPIAHRLLNQFLNQIEDFTAWDRLYLDSDYFINSLFRAEPDIAPLSWNRTFKQLDGYSYSLYLAHLYGLIKKRRMKELDEIARNFPRGLPNHDEFTYFTLEEGVDWMVCQVQKAPNPFFGYYHFFPPHHPYNTRLDFYEVFTEDEFRPLEKPKHLFGSEKPLKSINLERRWYDEFILYVDAEFARFYRLMEQSGILENTWVVLTTDHGEMFERGIVGHITQVLHQPVIHVPLLIFPPRQRERVDVYELTSAIDLLPTLLHVTNQESAPWAEGEVMPPFSKPESITQREVYALHGDTDNNGVINRGTAMLTKENYKLTWYFGYEQIKDVGDMIELYDISADPEELDNLSLKLQGVVDELMERLKIKFVEMEDIQ